ncbi:MAG: hypothetical protein ACKOYC_03915 [Bacteroidota bacterium]
MRPKHKISLILFSLISIVWLHESVAQTKPPRILASISFGIAAPSKPFSSTNINNERAGFAKSGNIGGLDAAYRLEKNFGVCGSLRLGNHPLDVLALANGYAGFYGGRFTVTSERWNHLDLFAGAFITIPVNRFHFDLKIMPGLSEFSYPSILAESDQVSVYQAAASANAISFCGMLNIRYTLSESFSLIAGIETVRSKPEFIVSVEANGNNGVYVVDQPFVTNNMMIGLAYNIY